MSEFIQLKKNYTQNIRTHENRATYAFVLTTHKLRSKTNFLLNMIEIQLIESISSLVAVDRVRCSFVLLPLCVCDTIAWRIHSIPN